jgi:hypothetical protein
LLSEQRQRGRQLQSQSNGHTRLVRFAAAVGLILFAVFFLSSVVVGTIRDRKKKEVWAWGSFAYKRMLRRTRAAFL